jgi:hypothetical protein
MRMPSQVVVGLKGTVQQRDTSNRKQYCSCLSLACKTRQRYILRFENVMIFTKVREILLLVTHFSINMWRTIFIITLYDIEL